MSLESLLVVNPLFPIPYSLFFARAQLLCDQPNFLDPWSDINIEHDLALSIEV